ncbi:MAG TPA: CPBP family intramembrane metalloprotease [Prolixibacteraceae bacterium]|nr:CPBP family intramembrane metalloprotease [Prolixibacteraceae bacterium]
MKRTLLSRYFLVTFCWSWIIWISAALLCKAGTLGDQPADKVIKTVVLVLGAFGPMVGALVAVRAEKNKGEVGLYLKRFLSFNIGYKAFIFPLLILCGTTLLAWFLPSLFGYEKISMLLPSAWVFVPYLVAMMIFGGGQEEFGWRAYALPKLEESLGYWKSNILLGTIWAVWHLPLWFIPGSSQQFMHFVGFLMLTVGYSLLFSWFRKLAGGKPFSGLYVHGLANAFIPLFPILIMQQGTPQPAFWIWVSLTLLSGIAVGLATTKKQIER